MKPKLTTRILKYLLIASVGISFAVALIWIALQGYLFAWTGFGDFTKPNSDFVRGKTLWDWMQLFIIPIFLSVGVFMLNRSERKSESQRAEERSKLEREIAIDRQREAALQAYLDRIADLLLKDKLRTTGNEEAQDVARIRTRTLLRGMDAKRKKLVLLFLQEAGLIENTPIINIAGADFREAELVGADLSKANLSKADLSYADLSNAILDETDLRRTFLECTNLHEAFLTSADLRGAFLQGADLSKAYFKGADLSEAYLEGADLTGAKITDKQLATTKSLQGATMPDGTIHE